MISTCYIDTETIPAATFYQDQVAANVKAPATYTKPETIAQWQETKGEQARLDAVHATGLMPAYNQIVSLAWAFEGGTPMVYSGPEAGILEAFMEDVSRIVSGTRNGLSIRWVGHNIVGFDLPCIWWACIRNKVPYAFLPHPRQVKPWETTKVVDTLYQLAGTNTKGMSLGNMAKLFGIEDRLPDMDGSKVWNMYCYGRIAEIEDYNIADVEITRELYLRIRDWI
jgi:Predicted 3'-5' exonuclease related to the exonuclease domain of PolB